MKTPSKCRACGSSELIWFSFRNSVEAQDGQLRMPEIAYDFILGCKECSETLRVLRADDVVEYLTRLHASTAQQPTGEVCENSPKPMLGEDTVFGRLYYQATDYLALQGEVHRLREALEYIAAIYPHGNPHSVEAALVSAVETAEQALAASTGKEVEK